MTTKTNKPTLKKFLFSVIITSIIFPAVVLLAAGDWLWLEGWIFALWFDVMVVSNMLYLYRNDPDLMAERSKAPGSENQKKWDKYLLSFAYVMAIVWFIIMPIESKRFAWSIHFPWIIKVIGGLALIPALYFIYKATAENTYMSTLVRLQSERKHQVISTGVYGFVRHPLYLGCLLMLFGAPLLLGSLIGLLIAVIALFVLVVRIIGEEKMLADELEGYQEYKKKVTFRLIPFIW